jgi:hypothetical protein
VTACSSCQWIEAPVVNELCWTKKEDLGMSALEGSRFFLHLFSIHGDDISWKLLARLDETNLYKEYKFNRASIVFAISFDMRSGIHSIILLYDFFEPVIFFTHKTTENFSLW